MPKRTRNYRDTFLEDLRDPVEASAYLNAANIELLAWIQANRARIDAMLLRLWSQSVGTQSYDKDEWKAFQQAIYEIIYFPQDLPRPAQPMRPDWRGLIRRLAQICFDERNALGGMILRNAAGHLSDHEDGFPPWRSDLRPSSVEPVFAEGAP